jgi:site-specific recombinase XerD
MILAVTANDAPAEIVLLPTRDPQEEIMRLVLDAASSPNTRRAYERALRDVLGFCRREGRPLHRTTVQAHVAELRNQGMGAASINQRLAAIRRLAGEAAANGVEVDVGGIASVKGVKASGRRSGNWLTISQAEALLRAPDTSTPRGLRDRAMLALLIGCGLRRAELVRLEYSQIQQRDGRWAIIDLVGKRRRMRSVPMPGWAKEAVNAWAALVDSASGRVFRLVHKSGSLRAEGISNQVVYEVVKEYGQMIGLEELAPHDLRRTFARLAYEGGSTMDQIKESLGHSSVQTTERYIGSMQSFRDAPADRLGIRL